MAIEKQERLYEVLVRFDHETGAVKGAHQRMIQTLVEDGVDLVPPRELMPTALDPVVVSGLLDAHIAPTLNRITDCEKAVALLEQENKVLARNLADRDRTIAQLSAALRAGAEVS